MFSRKRLILLCCFLLPLAAVSLHLMARRQVQATALPAPPASLPYAAPGPHPVGLRSATTGGEPAIPLTLWYPAARAPHRAQTSRYAYQVKMGAPFGTLSIASYPGQAIPDAPAIHSETPLPLVILSPGFAIGSLAYGWLAEHLASYGMVVISPDHAEHLDPSDQLWRATVTRPRDILAVLDDVDARVEAGGALNDLLDPGRIAVVGHSLGGYTALSAAGAQIDSAAFRQHCENAQQANEPAVWLCDQLLPRLPQMAALAGLDELPGQLWPAQSSARIAALVSMAGDAYFFAEAGLASISAPLMVLGGTADDDTPYAWGTQPTYEFASSATKVQVALQDAGHMVFSAPCVASPWYLKPLSGEFCADNGWDRMQAHHLVKHLTTAFLLAELVQDPAAASLLQPGALQFPAVTIEVQGY